VAMIFMRVRQRRTVRAGRRLPDWVMTELSPDTRPYLDVGALVELRFGDPVTFVRKLHKRDERRTRRARPPSEATEWAS
jgi:hypothetical protein